MTTSTKLAIAALVLGALALLVALQWGGSREAPATPHATEPSPDDAPPPVAPADPGAAHGGTAGADPERLDVTATESGASFEQGVRGRVVDQRGTPIPGARVFLMEGLGIDLMTSMMLAHRGVVLPPIAVATTDDLGRFALGLRRPMPKPYEIRALHDRFADALVPNMRLVNAQWFDAGDVVMEDGITVYGRVTVAGSPGLPVAGAQVHALALLSAASFNPTPGRERGVTALTDGNGFYRFDNIRQGLVSLTALAPGFAKYEHSNVEVRAQGDNRRDFELPHGRSISGTVTDPAGRGVARAKVRAVSISASPPVVEEAIADPDGRFEVIGLVDGPFGLTAQAPGFVQTEVTPVQAGTQDQPIVLERQCAASLRVLAKGGRPVRSYEVALKRYFEGQEQFGLVQSIPVHHVSGRDLSNDGVFTLSGIDPGSYVFEVTADGFAKTYSTHFTVATASVVPLVEVPMNDGGQLTGSVVGPDGKPVAGATVDTLPNFLDENPLTVMFGSMIPAKTTRATTTTGADGTFAFERLAPGTYQLKFTHASFADQNLKDLAVDEARRTEVPTVHLVPGTAISGTVAMDGRPAPQVKVTVSSLPDAQKPEQKTITAEAMTDASGAFALAKRLPPGNYSARAARQTLGSPLLQVLDYASTQRDFALAPGQESFMLNLSIQPNPSQGR